MKTLLKNIWRKLLRGRQPLLFLAGGVLAALLGTSKAEATGAIGTVTFQASETVSWSAQNTIVGQDYSPNTNGSTIAKTVKLGTTAANNAAGGSDLIYSAITTITAASNASIDLTAINNILGVAAAFVRVKYICIRLLSVADDASNGTAASSITIDGTVANAFLSATTGWLTNATSKFDILNGSKESYGNANAAGIAVSGTVKVIKIINNDGAVTAAVQVTVVGGST